MPISCLLALSLFASAFSAAEDPTPTELARARTRAERIERDAHLSFGGLTAQRAREALAQDVGEDSPTRPGTLVALGCSGGLAEAAELEERAAGGRLRDRQAAILALGELGAVGRGALGRLLRGETEGVEEYLVLAWIHNGADTAARDVASWAARPDASLHGAAVLLRDYAGGGPPPPESRAVDVRLELRWFAARHFGLVDGRRWKDLLRGELLADQEFLDRVVLGASAERDEASVRDHLFEILRGPHGPGVLAAAVHAMPEELGVAVAAGVWSPADLDEWRAILAAVEDRRLERRARRLLEQAVEIPELEHLAGIQLLRAGGELPAAWLSHEFHSAPIPRRCLALEALGDRQDPERIGDLKKYVDPGHPVAIQASALVALTRLRDPSSRESLRLILTGGKTVERRQVLLSLSRQFHDGRLARMVAPDLPLEDVDPEVRFQIEVAQGVSGELADRTTLREWLREEHPHELRRDVVRALAIKPGLEDLVVLRDLFPVEDDLEVNVELAVALLRQREKEVNIFLRSALWEGNWNRSVLAGGLLARSLGIQGLMEELDHPPARAGEADLRRVGFAIGEFGGLTAVTKLARRRPETDPALQGALLGALSVQTQ